MIIDLAQLVEVGASFAQAYAPVLEFDGWRVAMLRHNDAVMPATFHRVERHWNTNEVFILTSGAADLIIVVQEGDAEPQYAVEHMRLNVAYNVGQSVWHHVVMTPDAHIILFERADTSSATTDYWELPAEIGREIIRAFHVQS